MVYTTHKTGDFEILGMVYGRKNGTGCAHSLKGTTQSGQQPVKGLQRDHQERLTK